MWKRFNARLCMQFALGFALRGRPRKHSQQNQVVAPGGPVDSLSHREAMVVRTRLAEPTATSGRPAPFLDTATGQRNAAPGRSYLSLSEQVQVTGGGSMQLRKVGCPRPRDRGDPGSGRRLPRRRSRRATSAEPSTIHREASSLARPWCSRANRAAPHWPPSSPTKLATYVFANITPDVYTVEVTMDSFKTVRRTGIRVSGGDRVGVPAMVARGGRRRRNGERQRRSAARAVAERGAVLRGRRASRSKACRSTGRTSPASSRSRPA